MSYINKFKKALKEYLAVEDIFLFWKGRVALYAILKAIGVKEGDEVILPAFTCVVVPNSIIYLRAKPVYVDIDRKTFNINVDKIERSITPKTKVIIAQNTYGLSPDIDSILDIARKHNLYVIEDCAHGFGGTYKDKKNGTVADAAFYSTQWNKPFSTGIGGIATTRHEEIARKLEKIEAEAIKPSKKEELMLKTLLFTKEKIVSPSTYWMIVKIYRFLSNKNLILGSSQGYELEKPEMPANFLKGFSEVQAKKGLEYFEKQCNYYKVDKIIIHRKNIADKYKAILLDLGFDVPYEPEYAEHTYLRFPLLVKNRIKFFHLAEKEKLELGDWFLSPIHPVQRNFHLWNYKYGQNPVAEFTSKHIINLPTHEKVDDDYIDKIYNFLKKYKDEIIGCSAPLNI